MKRENKIILRYFLQDILSNKILLVIQFTPINSNRFRVEKEGKKRKSPQQISHQC